jgi:hypothetical protein
MAKHIAAAGTMTNLFQLSASQRACSGQQPPKTSHFKDYRLTSATKGLDFVPAAAILPGCQSAPVN